MGSAFRAVTSQQDQRQQEWVTRAQDVNGGGPQGLRLVGLTYGEDVMFSALQIRDTAAHASYNGSTPPSNNPNGGWDQVYAPYKTAALVSTLNQSLTVQPVFSRDGGATWYPYDAASTLPAYGGTGPAQTLVLGLSTPSLYLPYVGVQVTAAVAPASGSLSGWLERLG